MKPAAEDQNPAVNHGVSLVERQTYTIEEAAKILGICRASLTGQEYCPPLRSPAGD
jgi:hypothetical protein